MPVIDVEVSCPVFDSFRVQQVGGMFDVPLAQRASQRFKVDVPEGILENEEARMTNDEGEDTSPFVIRASSLASALARSQRNCSPLLSTLYGLIQLGGEENPTAVNSRVISLIGRCPSPSITARSAGHCCDR